MNKCRLYVQKIARLLLSPPTTQLAKLLLCIALVSLVLIAIYDSHAFLHTKVNEYRSRIPSEYSKSNEPSFIDHYEHHVYDGNAKIAENYIDIDYKAGDRVYDEYDKETKRLPVNAPYGRDAIIQGHELKKQDYNEENEGDEMFGKVEEQKLSIVQDEKENERFESIYDETQGFEVKNSQVRALDNEGEKSIAEGGTAWEGHRKNHLVYKTDRVDDTAWSENEAVTNSSVKKYAELWSHRATIATPQQEWLTQVERPDHNESWNPFDVKETTFDGFSRVINVFGNHSTESFKMVEEIRKDDVSKKVSKIFGTKNERNQTSEKTKSEEFNSNETRTKTERNQTSEKTKSEEFNSNETRKHTSMEGNITKLLHTQPFRIESIMKTNLTVNPFENPDSETTTRLAYDIFKYSIRSGFNSTSSLRVNLSNRPLRKGNAEGISKAKRLRFPRAKRRLPQALIIGVRKSGTRALLEMLYLHPRVQRAVGEVHFFDRDENYARGLEWYRQQMPPSYSDQVTIEKSPSYFVTSEAPERIRAMNASVRLLVIVRDPVTRAISDYTQLKIHAAATSPGPVKKFEQLALHNDGTINEHYRPIAVSVYHNFMYAWLEVFPKEQLLIVNGDRLIEDPVPELQRIERFLKLEPAINHDNFYFNHTKGFYCLKDGNMERCLRESKGRKHVRVSPNVIAKMREYFNYHNQLFYDLVEENFDWPEE